MQSDSHAPRLLRPALAIVIASVVLVAAATIPLRARRSNPVAAPEPKHHEPVAPDTRAAQAVPAIRPPPPAKTTPRASTRKPAAPLEQRDAESARPDPALTQLTSTWQREERDFRWTDDAQEYITTLLQDAHIPPDRLVSSDCRQSVCRVEIRFESAAEARQAYDLRHPDYDLRFFSDGLTFTLFFSREGQQLSDLLGERRTAPAEAPLESRAARAESRFPPAVEEY